VASGRCIQISIVFEMLYAWKRETVSRYLPYSSLCCTRLEPAFQLGYEIAALGPGSFRIYDKLAARH
jgi:hypothetical protein